MNLIKRLAWRIFGARSEYDYFTVGYHDVMSTLNGLDSAARMAAIAQCRREVALLRAYTDEGVRARVAGMEKALTETGMYRPRGNR